MDGVIVCVVLGYLIPLFCVPILFGKLGTQKMKMEELAQTVRGLQQRLDQLSSDALRQERMTAQSSYALVSPVADTKTVSPAAASSSGWAARDIPPEPTPEVMTPPPVPDRPPAAAPEAAPATSASSPAPIPEPHTTTPPKSGSALLPRRPRPRTSASSAAPGLAATLWIWFKTNPLLYTGLFVFLSGIVFALKYMAVRGWFTPEARLALIGAVGLVMIGVGWRLRLRNRAYGLSCMGGGAVVLYLVLLMAAKLELLALAPALAIMLALVFAVSLLALATNSQMLAVLATAGGFLAPLLLSTGSSNYIGLFSVYAALSAGNLFLLCFRAWDIPALISFLAVYGIGGLWGKLSYQPHMVVPVECFLLIFFVLFTLMNLQLARHADRDVPDASSEKNFSPHRLHGSLLFGLPLLTFSFQYLLMRPYPFMAAFSALGLACWYAGLAFLIQGRGGPGTRLLRDMHPVLALAFAALAVPLAFDATWTTCTWALQGAGVVWLGLRQRRFVTRCCGYLLQIAAAWSLLTDKGGLFLPTLTPLDGTVSPHTSVFISGLLLTLAGTAIWWLFRKYRAALGEKEREAPAITEIWTMGWWLFTGWQQVLLHVPPGQARYNAMLAFTAASCLIWLLAGLRLRRKRLLLPVQALWPCFLLSQPLFFRDLAAFLEAHPPFTDDPQAFVRLAHTYHPLQDGGLFSLPLVCAVLLYGVYRTGRRWHAGYLCLTLNTLLLYLLCLAAMQLAYLLSVAAVPGNWICTALAITAAGALSAICRMPAAFSGRNGEGWRFLFRTPEACAACFPALSGSVLALWLACLFVRLCFFVGDAAPLPYIPLLGPLDLAQGISLAAVFLWLRVASRNGWMPAPLADPSNRISLAGGAAFVLCTIVAGRAVSLYTNAPYHMDVLPYLSVYQLTLSILWGSMALALMLVASKATHRRRTWFAGTALLLLTLVKLALFDLADHGTVYRIASFLFMGMLMLGMGYFCPLPPKESVAPFKTHRE